MTAYEYIRGLPALPANDISRAPSNSDIRRWLNSGAVVINGLRPKPNDDVSFPIKQLVFFPGGGRKTTM